jgi:hypothetical protein
MAAWNADHENVLYPAAQLDCPRCGMSFARALEGGKHTRRDGSTTVVSAGQMTRLSEEFTGKLGPVSTIEAGGIPQRDAYGAFRLALYTRVRARGYGSPSDFARALAAALTAAPREYLAGRPEAAITDEEWAAGLTRLRKSIMLAEIEAYHGTAAWKDVDEGETMVRRAEEISKGWWPDDPALALAEIGVSGGSHDGASTPGSGGAVASGGASPSTGATEIPIPF